MASALAGWGYGGGQVPQVDSHHRALSPVRTRPAHARRHVWSPEDDAWLGEHAAQTTRLELMMRFDCGPEELTRHLLQLGLQGRSRGRPLGRRDGPGVRRPRAVRENNNTSD